MLDGEDGINCSSASPTGTTPQLIVLCRQVEYLYSVKTKNSILIQKFSHVDSTYEYNCALHGLFTAVNFDSKEERGHINLVVNYMV